MFTYIQKYIDLKTCLPIKLGLLVLLSLVPSEIRKADHSAFCVWEYVCTHTPHAHSYIYMERERECDQGYLGSNIVLCSRKGLEGKVMNLCFNLKSPMESKGTCGARREFLHTLHSRAMQCLARA